MATRLKGNKGYFTLLFGETLYSSVQVGLTLALVNLPLALAAAALDFGANVAAGLIMGPKMAVPSKEASASYEAAAPPQKRSPLQVVKKFTAQYMTYNKSTFKDPDYTVGASAAAAGINFFFQGALAIKTLLTAGNANFLFFTVTSLPLGLAIGGTFTALGLIAVIAGNIDKWKGLSKFFHAAFQKKITLQEAPKKGFLKRLSERKLFNNRVTKIFKKSLLVAMTLESSAFALHSSVTAVIRHATAIIASPKAIAASIAPIGMGILWGFRGTWQMIAVGRLAVRNIFRRQPKKAAVSEAAESSSSSITRQPAVAQPVVNAPLPEKSLTDTFENATAQNTGSDPSKKRVAIIPPQQRAQQTP